jgi:16S rRNA U1498 N3-methylase RsmE
MILSDDDTVIFNCRIERWSRIVIEASKQSLVPTIPKLHNLTHFDKLMSDHIKEYDTVSCVRTNFVVFINCP